MRNIGRLRIFIIKIINKKLNDEHDKIDTDERKLKWDEENRLLASDDDGFVTNYWYDADGERIVSKIGVFASYGPDPRRIEYAGSVADF